MLFCVESFPEIFSLFFKVLQTTTFDGKFLNEFFDCFSLKEYQTKSNLPLYFYSQYCEHKLLHFSNNSLSVNRTPVMYGYREQKNE